jgi:hypothetical protein
VPGDSRAGEGGAIDAPLAHSARRHLRPLRATARVRGMICGKAVSLARQFARFWYCRYMTAD